MSRMTKESRVAKNCYPIETIEIHKAKDCSACRCTPSPRSKALSIIKTDAELFEHREYEVEKVLARQVIEEDILYLIKWAGYPKSYNTWEPAANLVNCENVIMEFEQIINANREPKRDKSDVKLSKGTRSVTRMEEVSQRPPHDLSGIVEQDGIAYFEVMWKKGDISRGKVAAKVANETWPALVIRFYERRIKWRDSEIEEDGHESSGLAEDMEDHTLGQLDDEDRGQDEELEDENEEKRCDVVEVEEQDDVEDAQVLKVEMQETKGGLDEIHEDEVEVDEGEEDVDILRD